MRYNSNSLWLTVFFSLTLLAPLQAQAGGNANFMLAGRELDEDFWGPNEGQGVFGVNVDFGPDRWPVSVALGLSGSSAEEDLVFDCPLCQAFGLDPGDLEILDPAGITLESSLSEFSAGVLYRPRGERKVIPFVGGGLAFVTAEQELALGSLRFSEDDQSVGLYVNGGVYWRIGKRFNIGLDGRVVLGTSIQLFGEKGDANYGQLGMLLGWGW